MQRLRDEAALFEALAGAGVLLFKHSTRCGTSLRAYREVEAFEAATCALPVYLIDVIDDRALSNLAAERLGVVHASPQVILVVSGRAVWHTSHGAIRAELLERRAANPLDVQA